MEKITKEDIKALAIFYKTFNQRTDKPLFFSEKLLTAEERDNYENALIKIKRIWQKQKKPNQKTPNN